MLESTNPPYYFITFLPNKCGVVEKCSNHHVSPAFLFLYMKVYAAWLSASMLYVYA